ncbi:MAG: AMP-binding protein, partial [Gemmatimonadales bacterium]
MSHSQPAVPLPDWLSHRAGNTPEREALIADGRTWTYSDLDAAATRTARLLAACNVRRGDRVAMLLNNCAGAALLVHATLRLGATLVPLNVRLTLRQSQTQLTVSGQSELVLVGRNACGARGGSGTES